MICHIKINEKIHLFIFCVMFMGCFSAMCYSQSTAPKTTRVFLAGAATSNITPKKGISINGSFLDAKVQNIHDETYARSLVLDDGSTCLAFVVMDLCVVSREILDKAKLLAHKATGIPVQNMLMSATHTHSGGAAVPVFQSDPDSAYVNVLSERAADALIHAYKNRRPAKIGWGVGHEPNQIFNRRWKMKPGAPMPNPFNGQDQVVMNPGVGNPDLLAPAGPVDPEVPAIFIQARDGKPIAVLANYSLHYVGGVNAGDVSADYYGMFANRIGELLKADEHQPMPPFVGIMTNGTSGDINNVNWAGKKTADDVPYEKMKKVADSLAYTVYKTSLDVQYKDWVSLAAGQQEITLAVRRPDAGEVKRAQEIVFNAKGPVMMSAKEVYARETLFMKDYPAHVPVILQAFRIGELAIAAIPAEVFVEIGLEIKSKSPFKPTFTISLANGYNGYLPTPDQHKLGGYETWRARSSYLEVDASPKINKVIFELMNQLKSSAPSNALKAKNRR